MNKIYEKTIKKYYREILNREPDLEGFLHYYNLFDKNKITEKEFIKILKNSDEYKRNIAVENKRKEIFSKKIQYKSSPPNEKTSEITETEIRWKEYGLPENMKDKTFLDVGCWAGGFCFEAMKRGAKKVLGMDVIKSPWIEKFQQEQKFEFLLCDVFSEKFLEIPRFDLVFCAGVLYHVENPISLLFRLKTKTNEKLILETEIINDTINNAKPLLQFFPEDTMQGNYSNWWVPNVICVEKMLEACEFENIRKTYDNTYRACFHASPKNKLCKKILPRKEEFMK